MATQAALVGRADELDRMRTCVCEAAAGRGGSLEVVGPPGIGKSRLLDELARCLPDDVTMWRSRGSELGASLPFSALPSEAAVVSSGVATDELGRSMRPRAETMVIIEGVVAEVERVCAKAPLLIALDDAQWADLASAHTMQTLAARTSTLPLVLLVQRRPHSAGDRAWSLFADASTRRHGLIELGPLTAAERVELAAQLLGAAPGPHLRRELERAGGNPFFIEELVFGLQRDGHLSHDAGTVELTEASPGDRSLLERLHGVQAGIRDALAMAAVLGQRFEPPVLADLTDRSVVELAGPLGDAVRLGLLDDDGDCLGFRHDLLREALLADIPPSVRRALHIEAARVLAAADDAAPLVAHHIMAADVAVEVSSADWLRRAAHEVRTHDPERAVSLLTRARQAHARGSPRWAEITVELAQATVEAADSSQGEALLHEVLEAVPDTAEAELARQALVVVLFGQGRYADAADHVLLLDDHDQAWNLTQLAFARLFALDVDAARAAASEAVEVADATGQHDALANAKLCLSNLELARGCVEDAVAHARAAVDAAEIDPAGYALAPHVFLGLALSVAGDHEAAVAALNTSEELGQRYRTGWETPLRHAALSADLYRSGRLDDALAEAEAGLAVSIDHGLHVADLLLYALRALVQLHHGQLDQARESVTMGEERVAASVSRIGRAQLAWVSALLREAEGDPHGACDVLRGAVELLAALDLHGQVVALGPDLARLAHSTDEPERARMVVELLEVASERSPTAAGPLLRAQAWAERSSARAMSALSNYDRSARPMEYARAAEDAGLLLLTEGADGAAREQLLAAAELFGTAGADLDLRRVEGLIPDAPRASRARPVSGWHALTPSEQRVARLVAAGLSNPEIAQRLTVSRRTVETHLYRSFTKLDVSSRVELAVLVATDDSSADVDEDAFHAADGDLEGL